MICPHCNGKGRVTGKALFGQGHDRPIELTEIGPCPNCQGAGVAYCCDGAGENYGETRAQVMVELAENTGSMKVEFEWSEPNPNDSGC